MPTCKRCGGTYYNFTKQPHTCPKAARVETRREDNTPEGWRPLTGFGQTWGTAPRTAQVVYQLPPRRGGTITFPDEPEAA